MKNKARNLLLGAVALAAATPSWAFDIFRDDTPIFPSTGIWWSSNDGAGRWGVVVEAQEGDGFPDGQLAITVFSYESANIQNQAWYTSADAYQFNNNWLEDGFIADMELDLIRSTEGTCLLCDDGENEGAPADSDVQDDANIVFFDSNNAILTVGGVGHPLVKAQWGDGVTRTFEDLFTRPMQVQFEAATFPSGDAVFRFADFVTPTLAELDILFNGTGGWNVYEFSAVGDIEVNGTILPTEADFQIIANDESHEFFMNMEYEGYTATLKLFSFSRHLFEGRTVGSLVPGDLEQDLNANVLITAVPSMNFFNNPGNGPYPLGGF